MTVLAKWHKYRAVGILSVKQQLQYRVDFVVRALFLLLILFIFIHLWKAAYASSGTEAIEGFALNQIIWYLVFAEAVTMACPNLCVRIRPEVRAVMEFFTTAESLKTWIQSGGVTPPMNGADPSWYANEAERKMADFLQSASTIRFDGSDLMPGSVGAGTFWKGVTDYVSGTATLDQALETIQSGWNQ